MLELGSLAAPAGATLAVLLMVPVADGLTVPVIVITNEPPAGKVAMVPLTVLPEIPGLGHTAPPVVLAHEAVMPVMAALTVSVKLVLLAALGPALVISNV